MNGKFVILGSAFAGVLRHKTQEFLRELGNSYLAKQWTTQIFGSEKKDAEVKRSRLIVEE